MIDVDLAVLHRRACARRQRRVDQLDAIERGEAGAQLGRRRRARPRRPSRASARALPLPWKMSPNRTMKISGKASVQKSAARSRGVALDVGEGQRRAGRASVGSRRQSRSARPVRSRKTSSSVARRTPRFWGSTPWASVRASSAPIVAADVARVEQDRVVVVLDRRHGGQAAELGVGEAVDRVEADRALLEALGDSSSTVPISRMWPWSMIASRSHRTSASSM